MFSSRRRSIAKLCSLLRGRTPISPSRGVRSAMTSLLRRVPAAERGVRRVRPVAEEEAEVRGERDSCRAGLREREAPLVEEGVDLLRVDVDLLHAGVERLDLDALVLVGLGDHAERVGADAEVRVHRDEDRRAAAVLLAHVERGLEDGGVHRALVERARAAPGGAWRHGDAEGAARLERDPLRERAARLAQLVEEPGDLARVAAALGAFALELVDLLDAEDRDDRRRCLRSGRWRAGRGGGRSCRGRSSSSFRGFAVSWGRATACRAVRGLGTMPRGAGGAQEWNALPETLPGFPSSSSSRLSERGERNRKAGRREAGTVRREERKSVGLVNSSSGTGPNLIRS